jgi:hypothetical protein
MWVKAQRISHLKIHVNSDVDAVAKCLRTLFYFIKILMYFDIKKKNINVFNVYYILNSFTI